MTKNKSVAIKIPVYNAEKTVEDTLISLLNQTYQNFIIYIFDNCSTDSTIDIIKKFNDYRIKVVNSDANRGWKWNFDRCLKHEGHEFTLIAHADDIYHCEFIDINIKLLKSKSDIDLIFSNGRKFSLTNEITKYLKIRNECRQISIDKYEFYEELLYDVAKNGNFIFCPSAFGRSEIFSEIICEFNVDDFGGSADLDAWLRVVKSNYNISIINSPILFYYRISDNQLSENDRGLESGSVFVQCLTKHLKSIDYLPPSQKKMMEKYIKWHNLYFMIVRDLKNYNSLQADNSKVMFKYNLLEALKLGWMPNNRIIKYISLITLMKFMRYMPQIIRLKLACNILHLTR